MALAGALVDRARILSKTAAAPRLEGTTQLVEVRGAWFRARLFLNGATDASDPQLGRWASVEQPQLLCGIRDVDREQVEIHGDQRIEVNSKALGHHVWRVTGEPQPLRRRVHLIGWLATVERVVEREFDAAVASKVYLLPASTVVSGAHALFTAGP